MTRRIAFLFFLSLLIVACSPAVIPAPVTSAPGIQQESTTIPPDTSPTTGLAGESSPVSTSASCADEQVRQVADMVASSYEFTSTDEVLSWFCAGAEFEDIALALETEKATGTAAEDMLQMRADGLTWEEIWQVVGLYDD